MLLCCVIFSNTLAAQQTKNLLYIDAGLGGGDVLSTKAGLNYVFNESNVFSFTLYQHFKTTVNYPADYNGGGILLQSNIPKDYMTIGVLMYGKMLYSKVQNIRYNLKAGIAIGYVTNKINFRHSSGGWFQSNYDYDTKNNRIAGIVLNPTIEFPFNHACGLSFGLFSAITTEMSSFGIEGNILLGKVRNRRE